MTHNFGIRASVNCPGHSSALLYRLLRFLKNAIPVLLVNLCLLTAGTNEIRAESVITGLPQRNVPHDMGTSKISGHPERVVALEFSFVDALYALGVQPLGIADDKKSERIKQLLGQSIIYQSVGTRLEPNMEIISTLAPDLIIADTLRHSKIYPLLNSIAPTIVLNSWRGTYTDIKDSIVTIAEALGKVDTAKASIAAHDARMADMKQRIPRDEQRRFLMAVVAPDSLALHTSASFSGTVFAAMGLRSALESDKPAEGDVGLERLASINPDVLFVATDGQGTLLDQWKANAVWLNISAVKNGHVFEVDRNQYSRFRGLRTAEIIAHDIVDNLYPAK